MSELQLYTEEAPLKEISRFQVERYAMCLMVNRDKSECYLTLEPVAPNLERNEIEWRRGMTVLFEQAKLELPEVTLNRVPDILDDLFKTQNFKSSFYRLHQSVVPSRGKDARLEWLVDREPTGEAKIDASGRVNFYEIDNIINVSANQPLARYHPPSQGKPGLDLYGNPIPPPVPRSLKFKVGKGARIDEATQTIYADVDGGLSYSAGVFSVEPVYTVLNDVDFSVGNVTFRGQVHVQGQVLDGFKVQAQKDVLVDGMVGACTLDAGGDVIVKGGIAGKEKGKVTCHGKLQAKYLSAVTAQVEGDVEILSEIVNSRVDCNGSVLVPRGKVFSSTIVANADVVCDTLGSPLGVRTRVSAGLNQQHKDRVRQIDEDIDNLSSLFDKIKVKIAPIIADPAKRAALPGQKIDVIQKLALELKNIKEEVVELRDARVGLAQTISENIGRKIVAYNKIFPGVEIQIADCRRNVETEILGPVKFIVDQVNRVIVTRRLSTAKPT